MKVFVILWLFNYGFNFFWGGGGKKCKSVITFNMTTIFKTIATFKHIVIKHVCYYLKSPAGGAGTVGMEWFTNSNVPVNSHSYYSQHRG